MGKNPVLDGTTDGASHFDQEEIAKLAYAIWEVRGGGDGHAEQDWLEAEQQLLANAQLREAASAKAVQNGLTPPAESADPVLRLENASEAA